MIVLRCPHCLELRTEEELVNGGEPVARPREPASVQDAEWTDYLFMRDNRKGGSVEQWCCHYGCGGWFVVWRDTVTHDVERIEKFA